MIYARASCWAITLSAYNYTVQYTPGKDHANAPLSVEHLHNYTYNRGFSVTKGKTGVLPCDSQADPNLERKRYSST